MKKKRMKLGTNPKSLANLKPAQKGEPSRNPKGRPVGAHKSFAATIKEILVSRLTLKDLQILKKSRNTRDFANQMIKLSKDMGSELTLREAITFSQIMKALMGDTYAFNSIADREEGRPKQTIDGQVTNYTSFLEDAPDPEGNQ